MQINFLTVYCATEDLEASKVSAQEDLLRQWQESLRTFNIKAINRANISFKDWDLFGYPNQDRLKCKINNSISAIKRKNRLTNTPYYWWFLGNRYDDFELFYKDLAKTHQLMELVITVEEE